MKYERNYTIQTQPAGAVSAERRGWLTTDYRLHSTDALPANIQPFSEELLFPSAVSHDNDFHAPLLAQLYCVPRELVDIQVSKLQPDDFLTVAALQTGQCVALDMHGRFGYNGKPMIIAGTIIDYANETATITVWG
jgi:hypothetical protein